MSDQDHNQDQGASGGIRLPPITFLGNLNNPSHSPPPHVQPQQLSGATLPHTFGQGPPSQSPPPVALSGGNGSRQSISSLTSSLQAHSLMGLGHLVSNSTDSRSATSNFQLPPLGGSVSESGFTHHSRLPSMDNPAPELMPEDDNKRAMYSLPTPVQMGIDTRRQNILESLVQDLQQQHDQLLKLKEEEEIKDKRLKEERKRKNKERRDREKQLKQQQQLLYLDQNEYERRELIEENDRRPDVTVAHQHSAQYITQSHQHEPSLHEKRPFVEYEEAPKRQEYVPFKRQLTTINNSTVLEDAEVFPRRHIGSIFYLRYPTRSTLIRKLRLSKDHEMRVLEEETEYQSYLRHNKLLLKNKPAKIISLLPLYLKFYINCLVDIKISYKDIVNNENVYKRNVWGTDIYTDDSDVVLMLYHCGIIPSKSPFGDAESDNTDKLVPVTLGNKLNPSSVQNWTRDSEEKDLVVTLLILPALVSYQGSFRNNYNSRSWNSTHDGGSIAIYNVKWCHLGDLAKDTHYADVKRTLLTDNALLRHRMKEDEKFRDQLKKDGKESESQVERYLNNWTFDRTYPKTSGQEKVRQQVRLDDLENEKLEREKLDATVILGGNDSTIILNQTTQIHHTDDTTIPEITKHDDTTIDDQS